MRRIAVLIPCYNEAQTIEKVVNDFMTVLPEAEIYVYDNNSTDGTTQVVNNIVESGGGGMISVVHEYRQGKGNVMRSMFRDIEADVYVLVDGDDTYPAESSKEMVRMILDGQADMVIGDRLSTSYFAENRRIFHNSGNMLVRNLVNHFFDGDVTDIMTGYRAFSYMFVKSFPVLSEGFEIETEMTIHALDKRFQIAAVPVEYRDRPVGSISKLSTCSDGLKVIKTIFYLYKDYRPFPFFGGISALALTIALVLFLPILWEYQVTHMVPRFPTLIVSVFFALAAILLFVCGLILDANVKEGRRNFELYMNLIKMKIDNGISIQRSK